MTKTFKFDTAVLTRTEMSWVEKEVEFTATGDKTSVEFFSLSKSDRYAGLLIDDVRVYEAE